MPQILKKSIFIYILMIGLELLLLILVTRHADWSISPYLTGFDTIEYTTIAKNLVVNHAFSKSLTAPFIPTFFRSPGYPFWLAFFYRLFGSFKPAVFFGIVIFAFSAPMIYLIMREVFSEKLAFLAGVIFAFEPRMAFSAPFLLSEQIFLTFFLLAILFAVKFFSYPEKKNYVLLLAAVLGIAALVRAIAFYLWPFLAFFFFMKSQNIWPLIKIFKILGLATLILILIMSPWLVRNRLVFGTWQPSAIIGIQLYGYLENLRYYQGVSREATYRETFDRAGRLAGNNLETSQAINIVAKEALIEIKNNFFTALKIYAFNLGSFFMIDGYKGIASYIFYVKPNFIDLGGFLIKLQFKEAFSFLKEFSLLELILPIFGRIIWLLITLLSFLGIFIGLKKAVKQRYALILFSFLIFYFANLTTTVTVMDPRLRMPINGFLIAFALVSIFYFFKIKYEHD